MNCDDFRGKDDAWRISCTLLFKLKPFVSIFVCEWFSLITNDHNRLISVTLVTNLVCKSYKKYPRIPADGGLELGGGNGI